MNRILQYLAISVLLYVPAVASPSVRFRGTSIILMDGGRRFELRDMIDPHPLYKTLHAVSRRGTSYYIVFGSSEMSRGWPPKNGYCGAGVESFIRWLHVQDGRIIAKQEGLYESCFQNRYGWNLVWQNDKLICNTMGLQRPEGEQTKSRFVDLTWTFDPSRPEIGLSETEKPRP